MLQITAACVCDAGSFKDNSRINLLYAGQILPEKNGGLPSIPYVKTDSHSPFTAAVCDGSASPVCGEHAAYLAAGAFRAFAQQISGVEDMKALLLRAHGDIVAAAAEQGASISASAAAVCVRDDTLILTDTGDCRIYLQRDRSLYLLTSPSPDTSPFLGTSDEVLRPHTVVGPMRSGDKLLLCTRTLPDYAAEHDILRILASSLSPTATLGQLVLQVRTKSAGAPVTATLIHLE